MDALRDALRIEGLKLVQSFIPSERKLNRPGYLMIPEYITVHDTGNSSKGANAIMHMHYLNENAEAAKRQVSWHFTIDDTQIVQHLPLNESGWHAGDGLTGTGNRKSIGIEICQNSDGNRAKAEQNAIKLIANLIVITGIPITKVVQHSHWSGKDCPAIIRKVSGRWTDFKNEIEKEVNRLTLLANETKLKGSVFADIPTGHWAEDDVKYLKENGIIVGTPDGLFNGSMQATRYEVAAMMARILREVKKNG